MNTAAVVSSLAVAPRTRSRAGWERIRPAIARFVAAPASPLPFGVLRIGLGLVLLVQALSVVPHLGDAYGTRGLVQSVLVDRLVPPLTPRVGWFVALLAAIGVDEVVAIRLFFALHLGAVLAFTAGWRSRFAAVLTWATFVTLTTSGPLYTYGVDRFVRIALFYCMFAPVGAALSCDAVAGRTSGAPSAAARLFLRVLQVHLLIVYAASGIEKASGAQWWNGEALWRSMMRPDLGTFDFGWVASVPWLAKIGCWATLLLECGYAVFVWPRRTSKWWALAILAMHAGIAVVLGLWLFSATMMLLSFTAWLVPCEPRAMQKSRRSGVTVDRDERVRSGADAGRQAHPAGTGRSPGRLTTTPTT